MYFEKKSLAVVQKALDRLAEGYRTLPPLEAPFDEAALENILLLAAERLQDTFPFFHPQYAGQMLKPPHPVARAAYTLALYLNPNNHALDGGRASSAMEKEAVAEIAGLVEWENFLGHLTGGGTMANLEALWVAGKSKPGLKVVASDQAHYTHRRISEVLGLDFQSVGADASARMDLEALRRILDEGNVGTVVATIGTTGTGAVDPLPEMLALQQRYGFRLHADAAYGGYFTLADNLEARTREVYDCLGAVDSLVIDPHKHGLQPYGCGCVLFRDPTVGRFYKHDSPYTYFSSAELHLGEISLECSRPGAAAVALWATQRLLPLVKGGAFAAGLSRGRAAALVLYQKLTNDRRFRTFLVPELDIVVWAGAGVRASTISARSETVFRAAAGAGLHLATFRYPSARLAACWPEVEFDQPEVTCLRSCLMKPEHLEWVDRLWFLLDQAAA